MMPRWRLDPAEVVSGWEPVVTEKAESSLPRRSVWLQHKPTGIRVKAIVPVVPGVPDDPPILEAELRKSLFAELEMKVAQRLDIVIPPG
jgi:hypothetical protein